LRITRAQEDVEEDVEEEERGVNEFRRSIIDRRDNEFKVAEGAARASRERHPVLSVGPAEFAERATRRAESGSDCDDVTRNLT